MEEQSWVDGKFVDYHRGYYQIDIQIEPEFKRGDPVKDVSRPKLNLIPICSDIVNEETEILEGTFGHLIERQRYLEQQTFHTAEKKRTGMGADYVYVGAYHGETTPKSLLMDGERKIRSSTMVTFLRNS